MPAHKRMQRCQLQHARLAFAKKHVEKESASKRAREIGSMAKKVKQYMFTRLRSASQDFQATKIHMQKTWKLTAPTAKRQNKHGETTNENKTTKNLDLHRWPHMKTNGPPQGMGHEEPASGFGGTHGSTFFSGRSNRLT